MRGGDGRISTVKRGRQKYRRLNNELRRETDKAREDYINEVCDEIMTLQRIGRYDLMYAKAKELGWKENTRIRTQEIEDPSGKTVSDQNEVKALWQGQSTG
ncbi:hypothetical protein L798_06492 [Zootermopsis nevadensis]|uniref:Uncharacterized protein n=1 Tax=Zootermopsis nevadensis TaxID=136037 RepID=A0A067RJN4_ZOONE|nr:hypothetical protein L798_06492 [Zootermopsis nevadensis]